VAIYAQRARAAAETDSRGDAMAYRARVALSNPLDFVAKNFDEVLQTIVAYGDYKGVPAAASDGGSQSSFLLLMAAAALGFYIYSRRH
jgi:hypothetical protein